MSAPTLETEGFRQRYVAPLLERSSRRLVSVKGSVALIVMLCVSVLVFAPVIATPYSADDVPNSGLPGYLSAHHISRWQNIAHFIGTWERGEGRFFPGAVTETTFVFSTFTTRITYKIFLFFVLLIFLCAAGWWVWRVLCDLTVALFAVTVIACCWQFRYPVFFDGITSFSGVVPVAVILMILSMLVLAVETAKVCSCRAHSGVDVVGCIHRHIRGFRTFGTRRNRRSMATAS